MGLNLPSARYNIIIIFCLMLSNLTESIYSEYIFNFKIGKSNRNLDIHSQRFLIISNQSSMNSPSMTFFTDINCV